MDEKPAAPEPQKTSTALVRKRDNHDTALMPPPPPTKRIKRPKKVIDEDSYTDALSQIIARDFFPGLLESETQREYLDALDSQDQAWISSAGKRLQHVMTPGRRCATPRRGTSLTPGPAHATPKGGFAGDTPATVSGASVTTAASERDARAAGIDTNMSLGAFQSKYTSEDNESFYKLLDRQNSKRAQKYAWLWAGNKLPSKMQLEQARVEARLLESRGSLEDDGFAKRDRLAIRARADDGDSRPAQAETWRFRANNELMFTPDGIEDDLESLAQRAQAESRAAPKAVDYQNTRMPMPKITDGDDNDDDGYGSGSVAPSSPSLSAVRDAIDGRRRSRGFLAGAPSSSAASSSAAGAGGETPRVNGYAFVDDEEPPPPPPPRSPPRIDLGPGDDTPNPFLIREQPRREALHHRMVDRISQSRRDSARAGRSPSARTPAPRFPSSPRVGGGGGALTPAAQRLWSKIGSGGGGGGAGKGGSSPGTPFGSGQKTPLKARGSILKPSSSK